MKDKCMNPLHVRAAPRVDRAHVRLCVGANWDSEELQKYSNCETRSCPLAATTGDQLYDV